MTAETARQVLMILRGNYPNDAWKLEGERAKPFVGAMLQQLGRYPDRLVLRAVGAIIEDVETLPSVPMMKKRIKAEINKVPEFNALPQREINEAGREKVRDIIKAHKQQHKGRKEGSQAAFNIKDVRPSIVAYARELFPSISDANLVRNRDVFAWMKRDGQQVDGYPCRLMMSKLTGLVDPFLQYPFKKR